MALQSKKDFFQTFEVKKLRRFRDVDWGSSAHNATQPILTTDPIPARYLDEAIPVDSEGNEISYTQGSTIPDRLRDEWGFN